jgi:predicted DNA-binding ribbon-helix-helix protein
MHVESESERLRRCGQARQKGGPKMLRQGSYESLNKASRESSDELDEKGRRMKSAVVKRSVVIGGHKTSVSLEDKFWASLKTIAGERSLTLSDLVQTIDNERRHNNLSSAIRLFVLDHYLALMPAKPDTLPVHSAPPLSDAGNPSAVRGALGD